MEKMLAECEYERWKPQEDEKYYFINGDGRVDHNSFEKLSIYDVACYDFHNCFKIYEEAEAEAEKILVRRQLEDIARRLNKGQKIYWDIEEQKKYFIRFNYYQNRIESDSSFK